MDVDVAGARREGSGSPGFVQVRDEAHPYTPAARAWLEQAQAEVLGVVRASMGMSTGSAFLLDSLLDIGPGAYPPLSADERTALLDAAPGPAARAQATYYLLRDRALAPDGEEQQQQADEYHPRAEPHPSATRWAARNTLRLSRPQRILTDALWLIDHGHLNFGVDTLIELVAANKPQLVQHALPVDAVHQLFFRLAGLAEYARIQHASIAPELRNHAGSRPAEQTRLVNFADTFLHLGIGTLFAPQSIAPTSPIAAVSRRATEAYLVSLCRIRGLSEAWKWLNERFGPSPGRKGEWDRAGRELYASLLTAVVESIATPAPLRRQLLEVVSLPFSPLDLQILDSFATKVPPVGLKSQAGAQARKARAVLAEALFIRYIQSGRYSDALALDAQLELQAAHFEPDQFGLAGLADEADELEARRRRRANLLRAARDVMPGVQRALLDVRRVQTAVAAADAAAVPRPSQHDVEGSWQDVSREDALGGGGGDADGDTEMATPASKNSGAANHNEVADGGLVPLSASAALRGTAARGDAASDVADRSSASAAAIIHASDPQAALISALVSNSVDSNAPGSSSDTSRSAARKSQGSYNSSFLAGPGRKPRGSAQLGRLSAGFGPDSSQTSAGPSRSSPMGGYSPARASPGPSGGNAALRSSPFGVRGRSSLAGGAPAPASFASPRRNVSGQLDLSAIAASGTSSAGGGGIAEQSGSPGMHLAYLFRQPERRYVATVDIPTQQHGQSSGAIERWAADQNMRLDTQDVTMGGTSSLSLGNGTLLPETPLEEEDDPANRTLKPAGNAGGAGGGDDEDDADASVRMPGAWDAPPAQQGTRGTTSASLRSGQNKRTAASRGANAKGSAGAGAGETRKRSRRAANPEPRSAEPEASPAALAPAPAPPAPVSSTPAVRRSTNVLSSSSGARNPRARAPRAPSGLRRMTRASSVLSSSSIGESSRGGGEEDEESSQVADEDNAADAEGDEEQAALPDMVEVGGHAPPTVVRTTTTTSSTTVAKPSGRRQTRTTKKTTTTTTASTATTGSTRRSSRLASQEPEAANEEGEADDAASTDGSVANDDDGGGGASHTGGEGEDGDDDDAVSETQSQSGRTTRKRAAGSLRAAGSSSTTKRTSTRTKGKK